LCSLRLRSPHGRKRVARMPAFWRCCGLAALATRCASGRLVCCLIFGAVMYVVLVWRRGGWCLLFSRRGARGAFGPSRAGPPRRRPPCRLAGRLTACRGLSARVIVYVFVCVVGSLWLGAWSGCVFGWPFTLCDAGRGQVKFVFGQGQSAVRTSLFVTPSAHHQMDTSSVRIAVAHYLLYVF